MAHDEISAVLRLDATMASLVDRFGPSAVGAMAPFLALARSIVSQQLSIRAALTIGARLDARVGFDAGRIARARVTTLRACGLSGAKAASLKACARFALAGGLDDLHAHEPDAVMERLTAVKGVGPWTAHMVMIFGLGVPDVWPTGDGGVRRAARALYNVKSERPLHRLGDRFRPYRSHAAWYLWRYLDSAPAA
jgi:DNA-3-methyladenine glycosylase II